MSSPCPQRLFSGQRFVRHVARQAPWPAGWAEGFEIRHAGISQATGGLASVEIVRRTGTNTQPVPLQHNDQLCFHFLLRGSATLRDGETERTIGLSANDSWVIAPGHGYQLEYCSKNLEMLRIVVH